MSSENKIIVIEGLRGTIKKITENYVILSITGACDFEDFSPEVKIMRRDNSYVWDVLEKNGVDLNNIKHE